MNPRLLVLDNALDHAFYRPLDHWAAAAGFAPEARYLPAGEPLPEPGAHSHVIVTGSEDTITVRAGWAEAEAEWLRAAIERGARVLGSCWGHQLLAVALAGPGAVRRSATPEFGWCETRVADEAGLLPAGGRWCFASHFDEVVPGCHPELQVLGESAGCATAFVRWGARPVWGIQAHPEVGPAEGRAFLEGSLARWPTHGPLFRAALAGPVRDDALAPQLVRRFLAQ